MHKYWNVDIQKEKQEIGVTDECFLKYTHGNTKMLFYDKTFCYRFRVSGDQKQET